LQYYSIFGTGYVFFFRDGLFQTFSFLGKGLTKRKP
jgi:hypothetical protein